VGHQSEVSDILTWRQRCSATQKRG